jgi:hypothetical protein
MTDRLFAATGAKENRENGKAAKRSKEVFHVKI